jgi:cytochrome c553
MIDRWFSSFKNENRFHANLNKADPMTLAVTGKTIPTYPPESPLQRFRSAGAFQVFETRWPSAGHAQTALSLKVFASAPAPDARLKALGLAAAFLANALLLRRIPAHTSSFKWLSSDWKDWAKIGLGVAGVNQFNKAINWHPPAWLGALETVALINPIMLGRKGLPQLPGMAVLVSSMVGATNFLSNRAEPFLEDKLNMPPGLTRFILSVGTTILGLAAYPAVARSGALGASAKEQAQSNLAAASGMTACARCGGAHGLICMTDIGEFFGAIGNWFHSKLGNKQ